MKHKQNIFSEIFIHYKNSHIKEDRANVNQSSKAYDFFKSHLSETIDYRKAFYILLLNNANNVLGYSHITHGDTRGTVVELMLSFLGYNSEVNLHTLTNKNPAPISFHQNG